MRDFQDKTKAPWQIDLTVGAAIRVHAASDKAFDLFDPSKDDLAQKLIDDLPTFWQVLWLVVEPQAREKNVTAEQFGELMAADCIVKAQHQFFEEWRDFFQSLQQPHKAKVVETLATAQAKALELLREKIASPLLANLDGRISDKMKERLEKSSGSLAESLDAILGPTP